MVRKTTAKRTQAPIPPPSPQQQVEEPSHIEDHENDEMEQDGDGTIVVTSLQSKFDHILHKNADQNAKENQQNNKENILRNLLHALNGGSSSQSSSSSSSSLSYNPSLSSNTDYKKKYLETKEKLNQIKKMRFTDTENLFEDFKIAAEKRDTDSKKYITQLKLQVDVLQGKNKLLGEAFQQKFNCDYEEYQTKITKDKEMEANFKIEQVKEVWGAKVVELDKVIEETKKERDGLIERVKQLEGQVKEVKQHEADVLSEANKQYSVLAGEMEKQRSEFELVAHSNTSEAQNRLVESQNIIAKLQEDNGLLSQRIQESIRENHDRENGFEVLKRKLVDDWLASEKLKEQEFERKVGEMKATYEKQVSHMFEESKRKYQEEFELVERKAKSIGDDLIDRKNAEISDIEKKLNDQLDEVEEKRIKENQEAIKTQKILNDKLQKLKSENDNFSKKVHSDSKEIDLYRVLTCIEASHIKDSKFEISLKHPNPKYSDRSIIGELVLKSEEEVSFTPIQYNGIPKVDEALSTIIDFHPYASSAFSIKLIETLFQGTDE
ncbi:hypothetical protein DFA_07113 [Cavenderia fasciculata]|uniref:Uncharacterized protein n=1 Tax=Cavenderia fasciculata TaxID=261658 RepID=F4PVI4_CACFS|nr:uncharacterized protein DFA_07113 [Cavenderia fasciculata]EGG19998.1 hypothetical protein DFA_07113 [Cavenderia fasciculata]|eukprot:XP_004366981.1 hypothetical protein DFA_07113 [Cavenderia fasciculata]